MSKTEFEVIIIGGSYAGLSAAMTLGRSLRTTLVLDAGQPCNRQTPYSHNFLTQDGRTPQEIAELARAQVSTYPSVSFFSGLAVDAQKTQDGFEIVTADGIRFKAKKLIFASGIRDLMLDIPGFSECWGITVLHCPYCHGYEIRGQKTAIIANGDKGFHLASLVKNLTAEITLLTTGPLDLKPEQREKLAQNRVRILEKEIDSIQHQQGVMHTLVFKDGSSENFDSAFAAVPFEQSTALPQRLGCRLTGSGHIEINPMFKTSVEGVYACGDNSSPMRSVSAAVYGGNITGAMVNHELTQERF